MLAAAMRPDHVPICPGCRTLTDERLDVRTVERVGAVLACACGRRYPIVDGVPIVLADPAAYLRDAIATVVERDLAPEVAALLAADGPDDAPWHGADLEVGDVLLFSSFTVHRALPNTTADRLRISVDYRYRSAT